MLEWPGSYHWHDYIRRNSSIGEHRTEKLSQKASAINKPGMLATMELGTSTKDVFTSSVEADTTYSMYCCHSV